MKLSTKVQLMTPVIYIVGIMSFIPVWFILMFQIRQFVNPIVGASFYWIGITCSIVMAKELAKEESI